MSRPKKPKYAPFFPGQIGLILRFLQSWRAFLTVPLGRAALLQVLAAVPRALIRQMLSYEAAEKGYHIWCFFLRELRY